MIDLNTFCWLGCPTYINTYACEIAQFWNDAFPDQYQAAPVCHNGGMQSVKAVASGPNKNVPAAKLGQNGAFFITTGLGGTGDGCEATMLNENYYAMLGAWQLQSINTTAGGTDYQMLNTGPTTGAAKPEELLSLDKKIDDGLGTAGSVKSGSISGFCGPGSTGGVEPTSLSQCSDPSTGVYNLNNKDYSCTPIIHIGGLEGDPQ